MTLDTSTPFKKSEDKHYTTKESLYLEVYFELIANIELSDYGANFDEDELEKNLGSNDSEPLRLEILEIDHKNQKPTLEGGIFGDIIHASANNPIARLLISGFRPNTYKKLDLYKTLACEAFLLEKRGDVKLSFFTYFTELEAFTTLELDYYKKAYTQNSTMHLNI
ncbi:hypothetical protein PseuLF5_26375 [Pseudomonas sp. LF-5]|uniref:hypothetical protein n=1 Tax=Pseudomonas sp. LF-5 TaxID=3031121 RepID=UPI0030A75C62